MQCRCKCHFWRNLIFLQNLKWQALLHILMKFLLKDLIIFTKIKKIKKIVCVHWFFWWEQESCMYHNAIFFKNLQLRKTSKRPIWIFCILLWMVKNFAPSWNKFHTQEVNNDLWWKTNWGEQLIYCVCAISLYAQFLHLI